MLSKKEIFSLVDYTNLTENMSLSQLLSFYGKYLDFIDEGLKPASICLYPTDLHKIENVDSGVDNPCVVVNFPFSNVSKDIIEKEIELACKYNAEIDFVFPTLDFLNKGYFSTETKNLLNFYKKCLRKYGNKANIKVIFETTHYYQKGIDKTNQLMEAMELVYDYLYSSEYTLFLKTSTGKVFNDEDHTQALSAMNEFVLNKYKSGEENLGIKISGGVRDMEDVNKYLSLLNPELNLIKREKFRFGASKLLSNLI